MVERYFGVDGARRRSRRATPACRFCYENPAEVGADRIVNAIAAYEQFGKQRGAAR